MSVLLKGLTMPRDGERLKVWVYANGQVIVDKRTYYEEYEAVELPDHGDLIDRSMLIGGFADWYIQESPMYLGDSKVVAETIGDAMKAIEAAPVVIPAERSEDETH